MKITHLAITHNVESDSRILHKMAMSQSYGNEVTIITSGTSSKKIGKVKILSISKDRIKRKTYPIYAIKTIYYALQNKNSIYHVHEVPLMPGFN